jgi:hypothetical protein
MEQLRSAERRGYVGVNFRHDGSSPISFLGYRVAATMRPRRRGRTTRRPRRSAFSGLSGVIGVLITPLSLLNAVSRRAIPAV